MNSLVVLFSAIIVLPACVFLIFNRDYEDGFIGRLSLGMMGFAAGLVILEDIAAFLGHGHPFLHRASTVGAILWAGIAMFVARHVLRFWLAMHRRHSRRANDAAEVS